MLHLKLIFRNLFRRKLSSSFIVISFTIAFCCCILVYLFLKDEFSFDKHNNHYNSIYRLNTSFGNKRNCNLAGAMYDEIHIVPGIEKYARFQTFMGERNIRIGQKVFIEDCFLFGDQDILSIFDFEFIVGNKEEALLNPLNIILTQTKAKKYFGQENPIGKRIQYDNQYFTITGVIKDLPKQSHFKVNFIASISSYNTNNKELLTKWFMSAFNYYVILSNEKKKQDVEMQLTNIYAKGINILSKNVKFNVYLEPLKDIHLKSVGTSWDNAIKGDIQIVYGFIIIAFIILGIAITNYMHILTSAYRQKIKLTGIKRINGAPKAFLALQQGTETFLLLSVSMIFALITAKLILPYINNLTEKALNINFTSSGIIAVILVTSCILSVLYPVLFFNSFQPSDAIKNQISILKRTQKTKQQFIRGALVTFQLVSAILLIISTLIIKKQLRLVLETKTGFDKENVVLVKNPYTKDMNSRYELLKEKLLKMPHVISVGVGQNAPGDYVNNYSPARLLQQNKKDQINIGQITVDHDFLNTIGAKFIYGRNFDPTIASDEKSTLIINKTAMKALKLLEPIGKKICGLNNAFTPNQELVVIGVIEDLQYASLRQTSKPVMYFIRDWGKHNITIKLTKGDLSDMMANIKSAWKDVTPEQAFSYEFMNDRISSNYKTEINMAKIVTTLSFIAIFLSILGILGIIVFTIQHKTKEIGIRKVNGARTGEILFLLNHDFIKWVAIAIIIACPIAFLTMDNWLQNFAYKTEISWWIFALAGGITLLVVLLTVSWQSWRAANRNPVEALRYE